MLPEEFSLKTSFELLLVATSESISCSPDVNPYWGANKCSRCLTSKLFENVVIVKSRPIKSI